MHAVPPGSQRAGRLWQALGWGLGGAALLWFVQETWRLARHKAFSLDEFQYAHASWLVSHGQVPYRDFFEVHFPLVYLALSPVFLVAGDDPLAIVTLRAAMAGVALLAAAAAAQLNRGFTVVGAVAGAVLFLSSPSLIAFAVEVRPDSLAAALFLLCLALLRAQKWPWATGILAGLFAVGCAFSAQKAAFYGVVLPLALLPVTVGAQRRWAFFVGAGAGLLAICLYLFSTGSAGALWRWCIQWAAEHQLEYPEVPLSRYLPQVAAREVLLLTLAAIGLGETGRQLRADGRRLLRHPDLALVAALFTTSASVVLQKAPYPYSYLPVLALLAVFAGRGAGTLATSLTSSLWGRGVAVATALALVALLGMRLRAHQTVDNAAQLEVLSNVARLTAPEDPVYDNSGGYVARPHVRFLFYTDALLRGERAEELAREVPADLLARGCMAYLRDLRHKGLPPPLKDFLREHYQPWDGDLWLWGMRFEGAKDGDLLAFSAPRADTYFLSLRRADAQVRLTLEGQALDPAGFELPAGVHALRYEGPPQDVQVLWLPADGAQWTPRPHARRRFSRLFGHPP